MAATPRTEGTTVATKAIQLLLIGLAACVCQTASAQTRFGLSAEAFAVYQRWVLSTCIGGDEQALAADLRRHASELAPAFARAIAEGPVPEEVRDVEAAATRLYERRSTFPVDEVPVTGVSRADVERFRSLSRQAFVQDQVRRFTTGYRSNAVAALGITGDAQSVALLQRIARNARDPLAPAAREALKSLRPQR